MDIVVAIKRSDVNAVKSLIDETPAIVNSTEVFFLFFYSNPNTITSNNKQTNKQTSPTL